MNEDRDFDKTFSNDIDTNTLAMLSLANNTGFAAGNIGFSPVVPPVFLFNNDRDEEDLTR